MNFLTLMWSQTTFISVPLKMSTKPAEIRSHYVKTIFFRVITLFILLALLSVSPAFLAHGDDKLVDLRMEVHNEVDTRSAQSFLDTTDRERAYNLKGCAPDGKNRVWKV